MNHAPWAFSLFALVTAQTLPHAQRGAQQTTSSAAPAPSLTADQVVARLQAFYNGSTDFAADFQQVSRAALTGVNQTRTGHVQFARPGRMRWDYAQPAGDVIVSDGATVWAYEAAAHQVFQNSLAQSQLPSALSFLTGTGNLASDFAAELLPQTQYPNAYLLQLRPRTQNASMARLAFIVDATSFQVEKTVVYDAQGNHTAFTFLHPSVNNHPAAATFQWTPPPGTQVVRP